PDAQPWALPMLRVGLINHICDTVRLGRLHPQNEEAYQTESYDTKPKHSRVVLSRIYRVSNREVSTVDGMRADGGK
ncbi:hypothetical protein Q3O98_24630, partial [Ralstonia pseudosolanacearum]|uniref:hypothetical protein n=1 Tax=Ralstonia pseudosolanacearum TaxID=1310165 RepID=UPI00267660B2